MFKPMLEALEDRTMPSDFGVLPPEINSARMFSGPGFGPLLSAAAWNGLAAELSATAAAYESVITGLSGEAWIGPASAATVPPSAIAANRAALATLVATNFLGQNTPAIAATEAQYAEMWAQDAAVLADPAGATLASPSTGVVPAAADEVSAAVAALFFVFPPYGQHRRRRKLAKRRASFLLPSGEKDRTGADTSFSLEGGESALTRVNALLRATEKWIAWWSLSSGRPLRAGTVGSQ